MSGKEELKVEFASLKDESVAAIITVSEQSRRFGEMMKMYGMDKDAGMPGQDETLVLNTNSKLTAGLEKSGNERIAKHIYLLAQMNNRRLSGEEMNHLASVLQTPISQANRVRAMADYIDTIHTERLKGERGQVDDAALMAYRDKKGMEEPK